ncbi:hypothetical protein OU798_04450 [Prolixibacteraceae bacterium Z1-6]|uniref:Uncharacterized protein n=1 Tax=Draconibacterium aestuarii TaxID=2998507 RepID=A0A9X3J567_9BACT|nr:hypothetical protein [Prolixibacteraceae bacterium Z1-6]
MRILYGLLGICIFCVLIVAYVVFLGSGRQKYALFRTHRDLGLIVTIFAFIGLVAPGIILLLKSINNEKTAEVVAGIYFYLILYLFIEIKRVMKFLKMR